MKPRLEMFHVEHLGRLRPRESVDMGSLRHYGHILGQGPGWTALMGDQVIGCAGICPLWPGVADIWAVFGDGVCGCRFWFHRVSKLLLRDAVAGLGLWRLQTLVRADSERNIRWVESLGFEREWIRRRYGPDGTDFIDYALLRKDATWPIRSH